MKLHISEEALVYINKNGGNLIVDIKVAGGWIKIEEPVMFLSIPSDINNYNREEVNDSIVYIKKNIIAENIYIDLKKILFLKYLTIKGIVTNRL